ncbi:fumarylacetoacetate hydrolase family protein [Hydrogenophaga sp.]|uniref:fumarylacetoacetate hydrolase family protein n=1 Tax=Hydrogenophaga sp. TaxID=1904254 RepID=UPI00273076D7|nr:fumarylacetoacetate hydrolase family protein [Hydrogenophaga sp.]MDP2016454.1 fumarylacetoacetate hydrolase family protein [Hydrogenophaga sp.]MDP3167108.1 fumarylacetoacetate hydrolase family protein [Hydrogenophaga sp.]MDP3811806.1 fumarylacetoacetate hydrolase family protein [Hydrogenophaga sp.]
MRIATFVHEGQRFVGQVSADGQSVTAFALDAAQAARGALPLIEAAASGSALPPLAGAAQALASVRLEAPLPLPRRNLWCVGRNYHEHARELQASVFKDNNANPATWPIVFTKVPECVIATGDAVQMPGAEVSEQIDYEAELAVIIGVGGKNITREDAMNHVYGYTIVNDVTARDVQMRHQQWDMGKSFDTFCPMGPWIVTADELDGRHTRVRCWVNDTLRQDGRTEDLIFDIPTLIETISRGITLYPGDVIATGTPAGVGMGLKPPVFLRAGDVVRIEIDGIGTLQNAFA